jgi:hypothetical protein
MILEEDNNVTYRGHVKNGVVVLDEAMILPEGTAVKVEPVEFRPNSPAADEDMPTLYELLKPFIGKAEGLPPDASVNLDHYLYGVPKQE